MNNAGDLMEEAMEEYRERVLQASREFLATCNEAIGSPARTYHLAPDERHDPADIVLDTLEIAASMYDSLNLNGVKQ